MTTLEELAIDSRLTIEWWDEPEDLSGHDLTSLYVERFLVADPWTIGG